MTVATEAAWGGWRCGAATSPYYGCVYGYPYCAGTATVIRLTGRYDYAPNYGYGYPYAHSPYRRRHFYAAVRGVRRVEAYKSAATARTPRPKLHLHSRKRCRQQRPVQHRPGLL